MYYIIDKTQKKKKKQKLQILQQPFSPLYLPFFFFFDKTKLNNLSTPISIDHQFFYTYFAFLPKA